VPKSDKERDISVKTNMSIVTGERAEQGNETYIDVKGPSGIGSRSKTPYTNVMPKYKKAAERAIHRQEIPKSHQKRVREYFESLTGGKR
jgi:hypothetical protein